VILVTAVLEVDDFLKMPDLDEGWELIEGKVFYVTPARFEHSVVGMKLGHLLLKSVGGVKEY
jgi:hypothetical protein